MKLTRSIFATVFLLLFSAGSILAQNITVTSLQNASWGTLVNCSCTKSLLLTDANVGKFSIDAGPSRQIRVDVTYPSVLNQNSGTDQIDYTTPKAAYNVNDDISSNASPFTADGGDMTSQTFTTGGGNNKTAYIYIYGDLTLNNNNAGSYSNSITITVTYI